MINAYTKFWVNYFNFKGRASRKDFWFSILMYIIIASIFAFAVSLIMTLFVTKKNLDYNTAIFILQAASYLIAFVHLIGFISLGVRRLHDANKSGWWYFINLVPIIGIIIFMLCMCLPTLNDNNMFNE